jgi:hypothetical protein
MDHRSYVRVSKLSPLRAPPGFAPGGNRVHTLPRWRLTEASSLSSLAARLGSPGTFWPRSAQQCKNFSTVRLLPPHADGSCWISSAISFSRRASSQSRYFAASGCRFVQRGPIFFVQRILEGRRFVVARNPSRIPLVAVPPVIFSPRPSPVPPAFAPCENRAHTLPRCGTSHTASTASGFRFSVPTYLLE